MQSARTKIATFAAALVVNSFVPAQASDSDRWDLSHIYANDSAWEQAKQALQNRLPELDGCRQDLTSSSSRLAQCSDLIADMVQQLWQIDSYASMQSDVDTRDQSHQAQRAEAEILGNQLQQKLAFYSPAILAAAPDNIAAMLKDPALAKHKHAINNILRQRPHTLDTQGEQILAASGLLQLAPGNIFSTLSNAEMPWPEVSLSNGENITLDKSAYSKYRATPKQSDRKLVFDRFWAVWGDYDGTYGNLLSSQLQAHTFIAQQRGYASSLAAALDANHVPEAVYHTLISETNANLAVLHRYFKLRQRMLALPQMHYYDIYPDMVKLDKTFPISEAKQLVLEASVPLGKQYTDVMQHGFNNRWMDVYPGPGKRSGAYMNGSAYAIHPYVLMNYNDDYDSVSTLAHEWGHALHSYLASTNQPFTTAGYAIFTAEIASTFNEALLLDYMLKKADSDAEKLYYLGSALENLRGTFFRQAMFAEYELAIHNRVDNGESLTGEKLTALYGEMLKRYHGHDQGVVNIDDAYALEWAYIPHFYYNFYVYQYATSLAASSLLADAVLQNQPGAVDNYLNLLKAGGADYPYKLLKEAGVDLASPEPYRAVFKRMNGIMDQMEALLAKAN